MKIARLALVLFAIALLFLQPLHAAASGPTALVLTINDEIMPSAQTYLKRGLQTAAQRGVDLVVVQLNTPGGSIEVMQEMVTEIRASAIPVVVYVTPRGSWAASAGALITLAGHAAAMAPETAIGAASPVDSSGQDLGITMQTKIKEGLSALARSLTVRRPPGAQQLADDMINQARAVSVDEALQAGLIDFQADNLTELFTKLDGFTVYVDDQPVILHTQGIQTESLPLSFSEILLRYLVDSNIVFVLLSVGVMAILIELATPGGWVSGFIGVVCLALAAYGMGLLTVNWFGVVFVIIAFILFIIDIKAPTHGALTAAGIGSFIVGALVIFNSSNTPSFQHVSVPLVVGVGIFIGLLFFIIVGFALRAQKTPIVTGRETLAGQTGTATTDIAPTGQVQAAGELWSAELAEGAAPIVKGEQVEVVKVEGLRLKVKKQ